MQKIAFNLNSESTSKFLLDGWRLEQQYSKGLKVYQRWEKNLGLLSTIRDIVNRMIILICDLKEPKETFDSIKIFNSFKLAKFWSGKRILIIKGTYSPVNGNNSNTRTSPSREGTDPLKNEADPTDPLKNEPDPTDPLRERDWPD